MIIGFCGLAAAGKTTAARRLVSAHGFQRVSLADPLRKMMGALGFSEADLVSHSVKETPSDLLCGKTLRYAMQTLGTEWGRDLIGPDFWLRAWAREAAKWANVAVDDVRFANEVEAIRRAGGVVVRIVRSRAGLPGVAGSHVSEAQAFEADRGIESEGTIMDLWEAVDGVVAGLRVET